MDKHYIVWYKALGGGLITSWLFQLCVNHKSLNEALNVFPVDLKDNNSNWFKYEKVPPNVGVISNGLYLTHTIIPLTMNYMLHRL